MNVGLRSSLTVEHALLGFLRQQPMHAYEMHLLLTQSKALGRVWHLKQSHLYALLARLERVGYIVTTTEVQGNRPPRKVMSLTPSGRAAFESWLTTPVAHGRDFRLEFLAKLYFAIQGGSAVAMALVDRQRQACQTWIASLQAQAVGLERESTFDRLVLDFRISQMTATLAWLDRCTERLASPLS
jgi:PadR family transcriptional regulator AphA